MNSALKNFSDKVRNEEPRVIRLKTYNQLKQLKVLALKTVEKVNQARSGKDIVTALIGAGFDDGRGKFFNPTLNEFKELDNCTGIYIIRQSGQLGAPSFKFGVAANLYKRLSSYQTQFVGDRRMIVLYCLVYQESHVRRIENFIKQIAREKKSMNLIPHASGTASEWVTASFGTIFKLVKQVVESMAPEYMYAWPRGERETSVFFDVNGPVYDFADLPAGTKVNYAEKNADVTKHGREIVPPFLVNVMGNAARQRMDANVQYERNPRVVVKRKKSQQRTLLEIVLGGSP